jgi:hypothetical protein
LISQPLRSFLIVQLPISRLNKLDPVLISQLEDNIATAGKNCPLGLITD